MSTLVTTEFFAQPGRGEDVANLLIEILGETRATQIARSGRHRARGSADLARLEDGSAARSVCVLWRVPDRHFGDTDGRVLVLCPRAESLAKPHFGLQRRVAVQPIVMGAFVRLFGGRHALSWSSPPTTSVRDAWSR